MKTEGNLMEIITKIWDNVLASSTKFEEMFQDKKFKESKSSQVHLSAGVKGLLEFIYKLNSQ